MSRRIRPAFVLAYGDPGAEWARRVRDSVIRLGPMERLIKHGILQFWVFGGNGPPASGFGLTSDPSPATLRSLIDQARSARNRTRFPELRLDNPLVIERWSLFTSSAKLHREICLAMASASRGGPGEGGEPEFEFEWIEFLDLVRPANDGRVVSDGKALDCLSENFGPARRALVIDGVDGEQAVVDGDLADETFFHLAVGFLGSDLGFQRVGSGQDGRSITLSEENAKPAIPCGIIALKHDQESISAPAVRLLENHLYSKLNQPSVGSGGEEPLARGLPELVELDAAELSQGTYSSVEAGLRREERCLEILSSACGEGKVSAAISEVKKARRAVHQRFRPESNNVEKSRTGSRQALTLFSLADGGIIASLIAILIGLGGTVLVVVFPRWRGGAEEKEQDMEGRDHPPKPERGSAATAWEHLLSDIERILFALRDFALNDRPMPETSGGEWVQDDDNPYLLKLGGISDSGAGTGKVPEDFCGLFATALFRQRQFEDPSQLLKAAIRDVASQKPSVTALNVKPLQNSFSSGSCKELRELFRRLPILVYTGRIDPPREVIWLTKYRAILQESISQLESEEAGQSLRVLELEDANHTYRVAFGQPLEWDEIPSLRFSENN